MTSVPCILVSNFFLILILMVVLWVFSLVRKDASIVDIFWGLGFVLIAWATYFRTDGFMLRQPLLVVLTTVWGVRLAGHIGVRNWGKGEDRRYRNWRADHGRNFWWVSLFKVFLLQGTLLWVISLPVQVGQVPGEPRSLSWLDGLGILIWFAGFLFETVADWQLESFKSDPSSKGKVMDRGLWAYTRHPNYFGECLVWWGIFLVAASNPLNVWTIMGPLTITILLLKVSGITLLESSMVETRPGYREYMDKTSAFLPWLPKKEKT